MLSKMFSYQHILNLMAATRLIKVGTGPWFPLCSIPLSFNNLCKHLELRRPATGPLGEECCPILIWYCHKEAWGHKEAAQQLKDHKKVYLQYVVWIKCESPGKFNSKVFGRSGDWQATFGRLRQGKLVVVWAASKMVLEWNWQVNREARLSGESLWKRLGFQVYLWGQVIRWVFQKTCWCGRDSLEATARQTGTADG